MCTLYPGVIWREISFCIKNGLSISSGNVTLYLHCIGLIVQYNPNTQHVEWSCFSTDEASEWGEKLGQELRKYRLGVVFTIFIICRAILGHRGLEGARLTPGWTTFSQTVFYNFWTKADKKVKICYKYLGQSLSIFWLIYIWQECKDYYLCSDFCLCLFTRNAFAEKVWDYVTNQGGGLRMPWPIRNPS